MIRKLNQKGVIAPGTGPSVLDVSAFGFLLWIFIMIFYWVILKITTGHWPMSWSGFAGIVGGYLLAWIIDSIVRKKFTNNSDD